MFLNTRLVASFACCSPMQPRRLIVKGAIFDVDGTILDSMGIWVDIDTAFFASHNIVITPEQSAQYQDMTFEESLQQMQRDYLPDMSEDEMRRELMQLAADAYANTISAKPGVCEYMHRLHNSGVKIAVATSGFKELCQSAFKRLGIFDIIETYAFSSEVGCNKSHPDIYLLAAKRLDLPPEECTVYEDIITGIMSADSVGFNTVAVYDETSAHDKDRLLRHSDRYITGWDELLSK